MGVLPDDVRVLCTIVDSSHGFGARKRHPSATLQQKRNTPIKVCVKAQEPGERLEARF